MYGTTIILDGIFCILLHSTAKFCPNAALNCILLIYDGSELITNQPCEKPTKITNDNDHPLTELHYIWCARSYFQFHHFLAISSAVHKFQPQVVHFHAAQLPPSAPHDFEWFEDVKNTIPLLELHETDEAKCMNNQSMPSITYLRSFIEKSPCVHHVIIQEDVVVNKGYQQRLAWNISAILVVSDVTTAYMTQEVKHLNVQYSSCTSVSFTTLAGNCLKNVSPSSMCDKNLLNEDICLHFANSVFLRDVFQSNISIAKYLRSLYYGSSKVILPTLYETNVIPKIGHYVYLGTETIRAKTLSFEFFMSILSLFGVAKLDCVYIHGTIKFKGKYWDYLMKRKLCIHWSYWPYPKHVWQQSLAGGHVSHVADTVRAQIFITYGGLHIDPDAYMIQKLPDHYWRYEAVLGLDVHYACPKIDYIIPKEVKAYVNMGVCLSMPKSRFFAIYQKSQKRFFEKLWIYNSGQKPTHIYERNPSLAFLDPKLQVVCAGRTCCPSWATTEQEAIVWSENIDLWLNETFSVHIVWPVDELTKPKTIRGSQSAFGRIANHILAANNIDLSEIENL